MSAAPEIRDITQAAYYRTVTIQRESCGTIYAGHYWERFGAASAGEVVMLVALCTTCGRAPLEVLSAMRAAPATDGAET